MNRKDVGAATIREDEMVELLRDPVYLEETAITAVVGERAATMIEALSSEREILREALTKCYDKFVQYAELHAAKLKSRGLSQAEVCAIVEKVECNREMADLCNAALDTGEAGG